MHYALPLTKLSSSYNISFGVVFAVLSFFYVNFCFFLQFICRIAFPVCSGSDDNSDDEEDLQAELEKIRTERAAAQEKRENVEKETQAEEMRVRVAQANPNIAIEENSAKVHYICYRHSCFCVLFM